MTPKEAIDAVKNYARQLGFHDSRIDRLEYGEIQVELGYAGNELNLRTRAGATLALPHVAQAAPWASHRFRVGVAGVGAACAVLDELVIG
jgi:hypothetical protein